MVVVSKTPGIEKRKQRVIYFYRIIILFTLNDSIYIDIKDNLLILKL